MKRKVTNLEKRLIADGYKLTLKRYTGKHQDKILWYEYTKTNTDLVIRLNPKRDKVVTFGIANLNIIFVNGPLLEIIHERFFQLKEYVEKLEKGVKEFDEVILETEIPAKLLESEE